MNRILVSLVFLCQFIIASAQTPQKIIIQNNDEAPESVLACVPGQENFAGTIANVLPVSVQSNDIDLDTIYLCHGDTVFIQHAGDQQLLGDPIPATTPGVGYAFYTCQPTIDGPELNDILTDPCIANNPPPPGGIWIYTGNTTSGSVNFWNDGFLQTAFGGGGPLLLWFAPITFDDLDIANGNAIYEGNPPGPCENVNVNEAFAVVYLNPIQEEAVNNMANGNCAGSFVLTGGIPEFDGSLYDVDISLAGDPSIEALTTNAAFSHGDTVRFKVPQPGIYEVVVSDGKSCDYSFQVDMTACQSMELDFSQEFAPQNAPVCVEVVATNFENIGSFQFTIEFDPSIVFFDSVTNAHPSLIGLSNLVGPADPNAVGFLTMNWLDPFLAGVTLPDGIVAFEICFTTIGDIGDCSDIQFYFGTGSTFKTLLEIKEIIPNVFPPQFLDVGLESEDGLICIVDTTTLDVITIVNDISCGQFPPNPPLDDGSIRLSVTDGTSPYEVTWQMEGGAVQGPATIFNAGDTLTIPGLAAGTYFITIRDDSDPVVLYMDTIIITEPPPLGILSNPMEPLCFGDTTGQFLNQVTGGIPPYSFLWNTGDTIEDLINISAGFYSVTVTDVNGCTAVAANTLGNPTIIATNVLSQDATCSGFSDGSASVSAVGGTVAGDYSYAWSTNPGQMTNSATGLDIQRYYVTVTDDNGCESIDSVDISAATILLANAAIQDVSCNGGSDGSVATNPSAIGIDNGGYTFTWLPLVANPFENTANNLPAGSYAVTITDVLGCNIDSVYMVSEPDSLKIILNNKMDESCTTGNDGSITVSATGGTLNLGSNYQYDWSNSQTGNTISGLSAGNFSVTVMDDNGCSDSLMVTINPPMPPTVNSFQVQDVLCSTSTDGQIEIFYTPGGGTVTSVVWSDPAMTTGNLVSNLAPGQYFVTITADDGCVVIDSAIVSSPLPLIVIDTFIDNPTCFGDSDGTLAFQVSGGTPPYNHSWSNGGMTNPIVGLSAGVYTDTISDANNCPALIVSTELINPEEVSVSFQNIAGVSCFEGIPCDGQALATASGGGAGTGVYTYIWESGFVETIQASMATDLCQGFQTVTIADADGCETVDSVFIDAPEAIVLDTTSPQFNVKDVSCFGGTDGSATVAASGGNPPYTYFWPHSGATGPSVFGLSPGNYVVEITDNTGCIHIASIDIEQPDPMQLFIDSTLSTDVTCPNDADGVIAVIPIGGNPGPKTYQWSNNVSITAVAENLTPGTYSVTVTDIGGCTASTQFTISSPPPIVALIPPAVEPECNGGRAFFSIDTVFGGNGPSFTYTVDNFGEDFITNPRNIFPGQHLISIFDAAGCRLDTTIFIDQPPPVLVDLGPDIEIQLGETIELTAIPTLVLLPIDSVSWMPQPVTCLDSNCLSISVAPQDHTKYTVTITDINGCKGTTSINVRVDKDRNVYIPNIFSPNGDGANDLFRVFVGPGVRSVNFMRVFDRWGSLMFEASDFLPGLNSTVAWDGTFRGKKVNPGVFVYLIEVEFVDDTVLLWRGTVSLIR